MSKADEMFKELGYKKSKDSDEFGLYYIRDNDVIAFYLKGQKGVTCYEWIDEENGTNEPLVLDTEELKTIMQKCKELRWIKNV